MLSIEKQRHDRQRRPPPDDPAAWLYRVAANVVRGRWRRALDVRQIDLRNAALAVSVPGQTPGTFQLVCVSMDGGTGSGTLRTDSSTVPVTYTFTIEPNSFATGSVRDFAIALITYRAAGGPEIRSVQAIHRATDSFEGQILLHAGVDGVTGIDGVRAEGNRVIVTVTANGAKQTWTYHENPGSDVWTRA